MSSRQRPWIKLWCEKLRASGAWAHLPKNAKGLAARGLYLELLLIADDWAGHPVQGGRPEDRIAAVPDCRGYLARRLKYRKRQFDTYLDVLIAAGLVNQSRDCPGWFLLSEFTEMRGGR